MSKNVQFICSENFNAPALDNVQGNMLAVLNACLVDGLLLPNITSFTINKNQHDQPVSTTIQFSANHKLKLLQYINLSGFQPEELNGQHRIIGVPDVGTVVIENVLPATQLGTTTLSPLGFERAFSGAGKAVFRNKNLLAVHRPFLRIDDSVDPVYSAAYAKYAKVGVLSNCDDINDTSNQVIPLDENGGIKNWAGTGNGDNAINGWARWYYARVPANSTTRDNVNPINGARPWILIGNEDAFYILNPLTPSDTYKITYGFGVLESPQIEAPYFLLATVINTSVSTSVNLALSSGIHGVPLLSSVAPVLIPLPQSSTHGIALPVVTTYTSGIANTYTNPFVVEARVLHADNFIIGVLPFLQRILKARTDPQFSVVTYDNIGYLIEIFMQTNRFAFNLGEVNADL